VRVAAEGPPRDRDQDRGADLSATIRRSEWGMTKYVPLVGDLVRIQIPVEAFKAAP